MITNGKAGSASALRAAPLLSWRWFRSPRSRRRKRFVNTGYFGDVAIKGYDPVAYFTQNQALEGSAKFSSSLAGGHLVFRKR